MFGKLLKYEFKATHKIYLFLFIALAIVSLIGGFLTSSIYFKANEGGMPSQEELIALFLIFGILIGTVVAAIFITNFIIIIRRFYQNIFGHEGYLTWTLPVNPHQIFLSKLLAALIWYSLSLVAIIVAVSIVLVIAQPANISFIGEVFSYFFSWSGINAGISHLLSAAANVLFLYFAISLGQLFKSHRIAMSFVFFFGISSLLSVLELFLPMRDNPFTYYYYFYASLGAPGGSNFHPADATAYFIFTYIYDLFKIFIFYWGIYVISQKKLNLE